MRILIAWIFCFAPVLSWAGKLDKGFDALRVFNYFEAKTQFESALEKDPVGASFGLSLIYSRNDNPFYQPDSALRFILHADTLFAALEEKDKTALFQYGIDSAEIAEQKQNIIAWFYQEVRKSQSADSLNQFIENYSWFIGLDQAKALRDSLAFEEAEETDTWQAYQNYFMRYPYAARVVEARNRYDKLFYESHTSEGNLEAYLVFIRDYRMSPYLGEAQDQVYRLSTEDETVKAYHNFILTYPENRNVNKAWMAIYRQSVKRNEPKEIAEFILDYPDYPYRNDALMDYNLSNTPFYPVEKNGKWGFVDDKGKLVVEYRYDFVDAFYEGASQVGMGDHVGFINKKGQPVLPIEYDDAGEYNQGFVWLERGGKYGLADHLGHVVLPISYEDVGSFSNRRVYVQKDGLYGYYDDSLRLVIPHQFNYATGFEAERAMVQMGELYGVIDPIGNWVIQPHYDWLELDREDHTIKVRKEDKFGLLSWNGDTLIAPEYDRLGVVSEGRILFVNEGKYGYMDSLGKVVIEPKYDDRPGVDNYALFENGAAKYFSIEKKYGLIDTIGDKVFPAIFEDVGSYSGEENALTAVKRYGKWGYANTDVKLEIKYLYEYAGPFEFGLARVQKDGKQGMINLDGAPVIPIKYDQIKELETGKLLVRLEGKWGVIDRNNNSILPALFDKISEWDKETWVLEQKGRRAYYDRKNRTFIYQDQGMQISTD